MLYGDGNKLATQPGGTYYKDGKVIMEYKFGNSAARAHELKHGYQFETGKISFNANGSPGLLHDQTDEISAYRRQYAFGLKYGKALINRTTSNMTAYYSKLPAIELNVKTPAATVKAAYYNGTFQMKSGEGDKPFQDANDDFFQGQNILKAMKNKIIVSIVSIIFCGCSFKSPVGKIYSLNYNDIPNAFYFSFDSNDFKVVWRHQDGPCYIGSWKRVPFSANIILKHKRLPKLVHHISYSGRNANDTTLIAFKTRDGQPTGAIDLLNNTEKTVLYVYPDGYFHVDKKLLKDSIRIAPIDFSFDDFPERIPLRKDDTIHIVYEFNGKCADQTVLPVRKLKLGRKYLREVDSIPKW